MAALSRGCKRSIGGPDRQSWSCKIDLCLSAGNSAVEGSLGNKTKGGERERLGTKGREREILGTKTCQTSSLPEDALSFLVFLVHSALD